MAHYSNKNKKIDILVLCILPFIASLVALSFKLNFLWTTILFYGLPCIYLLIKTKHVFLRTLSFALPFSLFVGVIFDYFAIKDNSWFVPTVFPFHIFSEVPVEDFIWGFLFCFLTVLFYEHFFDKGKHKIVNDHMKEPLVGLLVLFILFVVTVIVNANTLQIPYFYTLTGLAMIPVIAILWFFPHVYARIIKTIPYFIALAALNEMTALTLHHWTYTGKHFIGWVQILQYRFPFEELFYWMILWSVMLITYFEFFDDTRKHLKAK